MKIKKTERFADLQIFACVFQPEISVLAEDSFPLKNHWNKDFFRNAHPLTLELGCGQADYTVALAEKFPAGNYIGLDLKGSRLWLGAKSVLEKGLLNAAFIRGPADFLPALFGEGELQNIILSFPDPFPTRPRKTFVSGLYMERYSRVLHRTGQVHLKTDNDIVFDIALEQIPRAGGKILQLISDIRENPLESASPLSVHSRYEAKFRKQGKPIRYLSFGF